MARSAIVFEILIASPSDVIDERSVIRDSIYDWNILNSKQHGCVLLPVMWETHAVPAFGERPQAVINRQIVDGCDALIGTFWTRLGYPTGEASSGTVEEIERIHKSGRPVMLYFSNRQTNPRDVDLSQLAALREYQSQCRSRALYDEYSTPQELSRKLALALSRLVEDLRQSTETARSTLQNSLEPDTAKQKQVMTFKQMQVKWKHGARLRGQGHEDCQDIMSRYFDWYVENSDTLASMSPAWEELGDLANQLTRYQFMAGPESSERFYQIGEGILSISLSLMQSDIVEPPLDDVGSAIIQFLLKSKSRYEREKMSDIASGTGAPLEVVEKSIEELEGFELVNSLHFVGGGKAVGLSGSGLVRACVDKKVRERGSSPTGRS